MKDPTSDKTSSDSLRNHLAEVTGATSGDGKTYKSRLNEYAQKIVAKPPL